LIDCSPIPGLLGLRTNYISAQLGAWRYGTRTAAAPDCMQIVAGHLTEDDVKALAAWLSSRPTRLKLSAPFSWRIAEPLDADAAGQATFYCCLNKIGCEEGERDGHIDLPNTAFFASAKLSDRGYST
jgi:hypothetical protein